MLWTVSYTADNFVSKQCAGLTREELEAQAVQILLAGYETTASTLGHLIYYLALYGECQDQLHKEIITAFEDKVGFLRTKGLD